jgi:hypothetical protein
MGVARLEIENHKLCLHDSRRKHKTPKHWLTSMEVNMPIEVP